MSTSTRLEPLPPKNRFVFGIREGFEDEPVNRRYTRGILAMANAGPNTNGSQFFIVHGPDVGLPPNYTIFGEVSGGMDVVDRIASAPVRSSSSGERSAPVNPVRIEEVTISDT